MINITKKIRRHATIDHFHWRVKGKVRSQTQWRLIEQVWNVTQRHVHNQIREMSKWLV